jgi:hypothetical protein
MNKHTLQVNSNVEQIKSIESTCKHLTILQGNLGVTWKLYGLNFPFSVSVSLTFLIKCSCIFKRLFIPSQTSLLYLFEHVLDSSSIYISIQTPLHQLIPFFVYQKTHWSLGFITGVGLPFPLISPSQLSAWFDPGLFVMTPRDHSAKLASTHPISSYMFSLSIPYVIDINILI